MADNEGGGSDNSKNLASMEYLKQLETSMLTKFEKMMTLLQSLKPNPMFVPPIATLHAIEPPPNVPATAPMVNPVAVSTHLGLGFVAQTISKAPSESTKGLGDLSSKEVEGG